MGGGGRSALNQFPLIQQEALVYSLMERHTYFITVCVIASLKGHYKVLEKTSKFRILIVALLMRFCQF